ncbi:ribonuclease III [Kangiella sediminilitoris]|uniref:Ribonuclease 3 n=1 Tax=Kangiella sediminilitoris TaxID=1144748 RepID=A0A1B3BCD8_9GAMM|nr:ribonuclease III [Kangiella sediminilitoris]AOE50397.1 ribonuclease III [Kangiella sediminilitoris]
MNQQQQQIERFCRRLGYQFLDPQLITKALTHRSASNHHNERLEFLGDAVLGMVIARALFTQFPKVDEGQLSRMRSSLVKGKTLAVIAKEIDLGDYINLGEGELKSGGFRRASILADAFEAVIGAVYLDAGFEKTNTLILELYGQRLTEINPADTQKDAKTRLQELLQSRRLSLPEYELLDVSGEPHDQTFEVACCITEKAIQTKGSGSSRRNAEQLAAEKALTELQQLLAS